MSARSTVATRVAALLVAACLSVGLLAGCGSGDPPVRGAATWDQATWDAGRFEP